jgi:hypothetical protein
MNDPAAIFAKWKCNPPAHLLGIKFKEEWSVYDIYEYTNNDNFGWLRIGSKII